MTGKKVNVSDAITTTKHDVDSEKLRRWLAPFLAQNEEIRSVERFQGGQSNPTYRLFGTQASYVLRAKPIGAKVRSAHAIDREYRVINALQGTQVPVPVAIAYCDDPQVIGAEFYVMSFVDGRVLWDPALPNFSNDDRAAIYDDMCRVLAALHTVDIEGVGLEDFGKPGDYFQRQILTWSRQYEDGRIRDLPDLDKLMDWVRDNPPMPSGYQCIIHGDYRMDNMMFAKTELDAVAVIDWELSTIGDPLADLSYQCMQWRLKGFFGGLADVNRSSLGIPDEEAYKNAYLRRTGFEIPDQWDKYIVYNYFRFAAILEGVARRMVTGTAASKKAKEMADLVEPTAAEGWRLARAISS